MNNEKIGFIEGFKYMLHDEDVIWSNVILIGFVILMLGTGAVLLHIASVKIQAGIMTLSFENLKWFFVTWGIAGILFNYVVFLSGFFIGEKTNTGATQ